MKSHFTYSELQELANYREKIFSIHARIGEIYDTVVGAYPSNIDNEDLRKEAKVFDYICKETDDIADKIDFILNFVDISEENIDKSLELFQKSAEAWNKQ